MEEPIHIIFEPWKVNQNWEHVECYFLLVNQYRDKFKFYLDYCLDVIWNDHWNSPIFLVVYPANETSVYFDRPGFYSRRVAISYISWGNAEMAAATYGNEACAVENGRPVSSWDWTVNLFCNLAHQPV